MTRTLPILTLTLALTLALAPAAPLIAEEEAPAGYLGEFLNDFDRASEKLLSLAGAMPEDKFSWRPSDAVRTFSQNYMHVAGTNFYLARDLGVPLPEDLPENLEETVTAKADVVAMLERSQKQIHKAVEAAGDLDKEIELFGRMRSIRSIFMIVAAHSHEHLGQSIAYARSVGVVPPWSR